MFLFMKRESFRFLGLFARNFLFSQGSLCLVHSLPLLLGFVRLVNSKRRNFVFIMLECKIHEVSQEIRPMTCVLGLEGIALG
jgi:hypothetical protein